MSYLLVDQMVLLGLFVLDRGQIFLTSLHIQYLLNFVLMFVLLYLPFQIPIGKLQDSQIPSSSTEIDDVVKIFAHEMDLHCIPMDTLGRHFYMGQLYNFVNDTIVTGTGSS